MNAQQSTMNPAASTPEQNVNDSRLEARLRRVLEGGDDAICERLRQLDRVWTVGRVVKASTAILILAGLAFGVLLDPWWLVLTGVGGLALAQYMFARWSLLGELFHSIGILTGAEVEQEKVALKALRGDFQNLPTLLQVEDPEAIARLEGEGGIVADQDETKVAPEMAIKEVIGAAKR